ncbi:MAG: tetratricopeptide repeat protein [Armatimonadota bacterium]
MDPEDVRKQAEFERLFRAARINRKRGDYREAEQLIHRALEIKPDDLEAREFAADILYARGEIEKAAQEYKAIFEAEPSRASAEEKFARATIEIAEAKRQKDLLRLMIENPQAFRATYELPPRSPLMASILSGLPGLGHVYCGQVVRGIVIFLIVTFSWLLFFALRPSVGASSNPIERFVQELDVWAIIFLCVAVFTHVYAIVDAAVAAERSGKHGGNLAEPR